MAHGCCFLAPSTSNCRVLPRVAFLSFRGCKAKVVDVLHFGVSRGCKAKVVLKIAGSGIFGLNLGLGSHGVIAA